MAQKTSASPCVTPRSTPSRASALLLSQPRTQARRRSFFNSVLSREIAPRQISTSALLEEMCSDETNDAYHFVGLSGSVPPFVVHFCPYPNRTNWMAVADEDGVITLLDAGSSPLGHPAACCAGSWSTHHNAIFDFAWSPDEDRLITASGDQTCKLWDVLTQQHILTFRGHTGSVKTVSVRPGDPYVFASGSRDGVVNLWDVRRGGSPAFSIHGAHSSPVDQGGKRKRQSNSCQSNSVSSVLYLLDDQHVLATGGATDGAIKLWDSRMTVTARGKRREPEPMHVLKPETGFSRRHGISCLAVDPSGGRLLASSADNTIYVFDTVRPGKGEVVRLTGHKVDSFYVKAAFSPDGRFVVSGSSDYGVYLWEVARPETPPLKLSGHKGEVTGVAWSPSDFCKLATCSDDNSMRLWHIVRGTGHRAGSAPTPIRTCCETPSPTASDVAEDVVLDAKDAAPAIATPPPVALIERARQQSSLRDYFARQH
mmetsp:Transcript_41118/g.68345  ORF Transcript_41118/g.68345 Transcript_41118/m.68345 type:complete len:483 (-) Transcript_41118:132-1580(-)